MFFTFFCSLSIKTMEASLDVAPAEELSAESESFGNKSSNVRMPPSTTRIMAAKIKDFTFLLIFAMLSVSPSEPNDQTGCEYRNRNDDYEDNLEYFYCCFGNIKCFGTVGFRNDV